MRKRRRRPENVYALADPRDRVIHYVGKTVFSVAWRLGEHLLRAQKPHIYGRTGVNRWLVGLLVQGLRPVAVALETGTLNGDDMERYWIAEGRRRGWPLVNETQGGPGHDGRNHRGNTRAHVVRAGEAALAAPNVPEAPAGRTSATRTAGAGGRIMALSTLDELRLRIQDKAVERLSYHEVTGTPGPGRVFIFGPLGEEGAFSVVSVAQGDGSSWIVVTASDYILAGQFIQVSGLTMTQLAIQLRSTTFTDEELEFYLGKHSNSVLDASIEVVLALMYDGVKRHRWKSPDGVSYDDTMANQQLQRIYDMLKREQEELGTASGGFGNAATEKNAPQGYRDEFDFPDYAPLYED